MNKSYEELAKMKLITFENNKNNVAVCAMALEMIMLMVGKIADEVLRRPLIATETEIQSITQSEAIKIVGDAISGNFGAGLMIREYSKVAIQALIAAGVQFKPSNIEDLDHA